MVVPSTRVRLLFGYIQRSWLISESSLHKITNTDTSCRIFGHASALPIWAAPAALARLGHPDGEMNIVRAAGKEGIVYGVSATLDSSSFARLHACTARF